MGGVGGNFFCNLLLVFSSSIPQQTTNLAFMMAVITTVLIQFGGSGDQ